MLNLSIVLYLLFTEGDNMSKNMPELAVSLKQPTPDEVRAVRKSAKLTQAHAAALISHSQSYRTWQGYEAEEGSPGHRSIPIAAWELFLLKIGRHPDMQLIPVVAVEEVEPIQVDYHVIADSGSREQSIAA